MQKCPHCKEAAFSTWNLMCLGPFFDIKCKKCSGKVGVSWGKILIDSLLALPYLILPLIPYFHPINIGVRKTNIGLEHYVESINYLGLSRLVPCYIVLAVLTYIFYPRWILLLKR